MMKFNFFCIYICLIFILSGCRDYTIGEHEAKSNPINIAESGFVLEGDDGSIYFLDGKNDNNISNLFNSVKKTYENTYGSNLIIYDNYLYYKDGKISAKLIRMEIDNPENRKIISDINAQQSIIVDDMIYAKVTDTEGDKSGLYRIDLDGTNKTRLVKANINNIQYESDHIYYCVTNKGQLFRIDLNGINKKEILRKDTSEYISTTHFIVEDEWIYFENANIDKHSGAVFSDLKICKIRNDGTGFEELVDGRVSNIYNKNGKKYLLYTLDDMLYMMDLENRNVSEIFNGRITKVNILQDNIYVLDWQYENGNSIVYKININTKNVSVLGEDIDNGTK